MSKEGYLYNLATDRKNGFIANCIKTVLFIFSIIYGLLVKVLVLFYRFSPYRLNCKVISIGNITLGGTGKTSLVEYVARYLKDRGHKVAILSRGYKRRVTSYELRVTSYEAMGDEPYMLQANLKDIPVIVDIDRIGAGKLAIKNYGVDTVILDDGFQQWKIKKDLEVVTIDVTNPFGNRQLLPRGVLREPISSLKRADIFILTKTNLKSEPLDLENFLSQINPVALIIESIHKPLGFYKIDRPNELLNPGLLKARTVTLISGIADPDSFENLIMSLDIKVGLSFRFPDHYGYSKKDLEDIMKKSQDNGIDTIITTEKDAVRLAQFSVFGFRFSVFVLKIELKITKNDEGFRNRLLRLYNL